MRHRSEGCAAVLVYRAGRCAHVLSHAHDGGEAYMGPLLRKAVSYAKVQYESGDIRAILLAEPDMKPVDTQLSVVSMRNLHVRHIYYLSETWDADASRKRYSVRVRHMADGEEVTAKDLPEFERRVPAGTSVLV